MAENHKIATNGKVSDIGVGTQNYEDTCVEVYMPEKIPIELVQANEIRHYEISLWLGSLFMSAAVGFWTAYAQDGGSLVLLFTSAVFTLFFIAFVLVAIYFRSKLNGKKVRRIARMNDFRKE